MATEDSVAVSDKLIDEFGEMCKDAFRKQFTDKRDKTFKARMSNIGKPLCQLQMEKSNAKPEGQPYNNKMRNTFGDLIEALAVTIIKASGIKVDSTQKSVSYNMDKSKIDGTYDIEIGNSIYDIKSASPFAFDKKFSKILVNQLTKSFAIISFPGMSLLNSAISLCFLLSIHDSNSADPRPTSPKPNGVGILFLIPAHARLPKSLIPRVTGPTNGSLEAAKSLTVVPPGAAAAEDILPFHSGKTSWLYFSNRI